MTDLGPLFVHPSGPDYFWMLVFAFAVPTIALSLYALVRGQLPVVMGGSVLVLMSGFGYVLGNLHVIDESKAVEFCGSCHVTMPPLVESMRMPTGNTGSDHLAAVHYQSAAVSQSDACYVCHSGYGAAGGIKAKLSGMGHMFHTVMGSDRYPLKMRNTFDISSCLDCHSSSQAFRAVKGHKPLGIQQQLMSGEMSCTGACHPSAHPPAALNGTLAWERWKQSR